MDQGTPDVQTETQEPQNQKNNKNSPKHVNLQSTFGNCANAKFCAKLRKRSARVRDSTTNGGPVHAHEMRGHQLMNKQRYAESEGLLFVDSGFSLGAANFSEKRPGCRWNRHFAQQ